MDRHEGQITLKSQCEVLKVPYTSVAILKSQNRSTALCSRANLGQKWNMKAFNDATILVPCDIDYSFFSFEFQKAGPRRQCVNAPEIIQHWLVLH